MTDTAPPILLHAAGSLRAALVEVIQAFETATGYQVKAKYGPAGLLKEALAQGERGEVFASANIGHPQALADAGLAVPVVLLARNRLCALVRPGLSVASETLLDHMLSRDVKLATSTPGADPSGDYAWEVFRKADTERAGAFAALERKALLLTGGTIPAASSSGRSQYGALLAEGKADIFLCYRTAALAAAQEHPGQQIVGLPQALEIGANYGMTVLNSASSASLRLALFLLSTSGQDILARHGFTAPNLK